MSGEGRPELEAAKRASTIQLLFRCARLLDERALDRIAAERPSGPRLRPAHTALLPHLGFEGIRTTELARRLGVTKQAISQLLSEMIEMGVVEHAVDPTDARAKLVRFTDKGADAILHGLSILKGIESELEAALGSRRMRELHRTLEGILELVDRRP